MQTRSCILLSLLLAACSPQLTVEETCHHDHGSGGSGGDESETTVSSTGSTSSTTGSTTGTGAPLYCIINTGECQMDGGPANIGGACKTSFFSPMPNGHCDTMGNCCRPAFPECSVDAECQTDDPCATDTCQKGLCVHDVHPDGSSCTMPGPVFGKCVADVCK